MAPRQRNIPSSTNTPASSEDEGDSSSFDEGSAASLLQEEKSGSNTKVMTMKTKTKMKSTTPPKSLNITESDIARDRHDYFNIVALAFVVVAVALNYEFPSCTYTGNYFWIMWATTVIYFFMDLAWVTLVPICVKSPGVIQKHHIVAMIYLSSPIIYPEYRWLMGAVLSVELNTWFLICRRLVYRSNYCPSGYTKVSPLITTTVSTLFYITWIVIRVYLYPHVLVLFLYIWREQIEIQGKIFFLELFFIPVHVILCVLNLKWTYDLFNPIIKRWMGMGPKSMGVQNGL